MSKITINIGALFLMKDIFLLGRFKNRLSQIAEKNPLIVLSFFPIVLFLFFIGLSKYLFPIYVGMGSYDKDPSYVYLLNGLTILNHHIPEHFHHPGTPLQFLVAIELIGQWFFEWLFENKSGGLIEAVLVDPEKYIFNITIFLELLAAFAMFYCGSRIYSVTKSFSKSFFVQLATFTSVVIVLRIAYLGPESLSYSISMVLIGVIAPLFFAIKEENHLPLDISGSSKTPALVGILCAFGVIAKVTFLPVCLILFIFDGRKKITIAIAAFLIASLFLLAPLFKKIDQLFVWLGGLIIHSGQYGTGHVNFIDTQAFLINLLKLIFEFKFFYLILSIGIIFLVRQLFQEWIESREEKRNYIFYKDFKYQSIILGIMILQTIIVAKHYEPRYMIPSLMFSSVLVILWAGKINHLINEKFTIFRKKIFSVLMVLAIFFSGLTFWEICTIFVPERIEARKIATAINSEILKYPDSIVIGTYYCNLEVCAISFGAAYAENLRKYVNIRLKNFLFFNIWNGDLSFNGISDPKLEVVNNAIFLQRNVFLVGPPDPSYGAFTLEKILEFPGQNLYRVIKGNR